MKTTLSRIVAAFSLVAGFAAQAQADESPRVLTLVDTASGVVLADANDRTVYTFDADDENVSNCYDSCAVAWPPVLTTKETLAAPFGVTVRRDGAHQVTFKGSPLYLYVRDHAPADITGDGVGGVWHLAKVLP